LDCDAGASRACVPTQERGDSVSVSRSTATQGVASERPTQERGLRVCVALDCDAGASHTCVPTQERGNEGKLRTGWVRTEGAGQDSPGQRRAQRAPPWEK